MKKLLFTVILLLDMVSGSWTGAQPVNNLLDKLNLYQQKYPEETLYLHTDRDRYAPGDIIWFKAYIITDQLNTQSLSRDLYVGMVDRYGTEVTRAKYLITKDHVHGDVEIPPKISAGRYVLMAYTSWMQNTPADRVFIKEILVEKEAPPFSVSLTLNDSLYTGKSMVRAEIECRDIKNAPVAADLKYKLTANGNVALQGVNKADKAGKAMVTFNLPDDYAAGILELTVEGTFRNHTNGAVVIIPTPENVINVSFYPESGACIAGLESRIAFRSYNIFDQPVVMEGEIFTAGKPVLKLNTTTHGAGSFVLTPKSEQAYYLKVTKPMAERTFELPEPLRSGMIMAVKSRTMDSITLEVRQINKRIQVYHFIGQMKGRIYWLESRQVDENALIDLPLGDFPAGIAEITAFDENLNPVATRLLFVNQDRKLHIHITPDKPEYGMREKITLTIQVEDENGNPVQASLSLAAGSTYHQRAIPDSPDIFTSITLINDLAGFMRIPASLNDDMLMGSKPKRFTWKQVLLTNRNSAAYVNLDNIDHEKWRAFNRSVIAYGTQYLNQLLSPPGRSYSLQQKNDPASWNRFKPAGAENNPFSGRLTVAEMIYQIRPYTLREGKIYFDNHSGNSISNQDGAIIAINDKLMGTDISVLDGILPVDIDHIKVSTNVMDIQKYVALNTMGVVEVYTKTFEPQQKSATSADADMMKDSYSTPAVFSQTGKVAGAKSKSTKSNLPGTIYWDPDIETDSSGIARVSFYSNMHLPEISVTVEGISENGLSGSSGILIPIK